MDKKLTLEKIKALIENYQEIVKEGRITKYNEEMTKKDFILPLFEALGWKTTDSKEVSAEEKISKKRVDYGFRINGIPKFFLEAKSFREDLDNRKFIEQAISYSWHKGCTWAILTNFESVKIFNAEVKTEHPWLSQFKPTLHCSEFLGKLDELLLLSRESFDKGLLDVEAEKWGKKAKKTPINKRLLDDFTHFRDILSKNVIKLNANKNLTEDELDESVQRILDRLIFIRNCEDRELEPKILIANYREWESKGKGHLIRSLREAFAHFDKEYNSKIFANHLCDNLDVDNEVLHEVIEGLYTTKEGESYDFSIIDADVLGTIYEQYLGHILRKTEKRTKLTENHAHRKEQGIRGWKLKEPVTLSLSKVLAAKEKGLVAYILGAFLSERPALITFVFDNQSIIKMARHFLRHCSGSLHSCYTYTVNVQKYAVWLGYSPDLIIQDLKPIGNIPDPERVQNHLGYLNDYLAVLQDEGLKPGTVNSCIKAAKTFYRTNGVKIELSEPLSRRVTYKDRAPKPEELMKLMEISSLREKVMVSCLALGAFREETLSKLQYRHVKEDLENNRVPIHVHIEADITKGKYHDYDTFLGAEAAAYLKLYIEQRRQGSADGRNPPEIITDESPLIRDETSHKPRGIGSKQIRKMVHYLYIEADLIKQRNGRMYDLRVHSLRKFFKTQLLALGVQPDYVDYMMGHTIDTYHDIQSLGIDKLRNVYAASGLAIRRKTQVNKVEALKEIIRAWGMNPEQLLTRDALSEGAVTYKTADDYENHQLQILGRQLKQLIQKEASV